MASKKEFTSQEIARTIGAGKFSSNETVDFNDPNRPKTCLEVDFPIIPINELSAIEASSGATKKPIYQLSKWWARRQPSVFRAILIAAATKSPQDPSLAAKVVWDSYYGNHQKGNNFEGIKVADIFMGGGTTLVEGSRLGMKMSGNDLNPVAWFVVKQEMADINLTEVKNLLDAVEAEVKPQLMPYYCCDGPDGEKGIWTHLPTRRVMPSDFNPLGLKPEDRHNYNYEGPEILYAFWAKHGPCQVTGCGHRTPIMGSPVMAMKSITIKHWNHNCVKCGIDFHVEESEARMAPDATLFVSPLEHPHSILDHKKGAVCPNCGHAELTNLGKGKNKKVDLSLLVAPKWLAGSVCKDEFERPYGGSPHDDAASSETWYAERSKELNLLEVRGLLPPEITCPDTGKVFATGARGGTVPKRSHFQCAGCGTVQNLLYSTRHSGKAAPLAGFAVQAYSPKRNENGKPYRGRFFAAFDSPFAEQYVAAFEEWEARKDNDLADYWPQSAIPIGAEIGPHDVEGHHFTHWWTMFNARQLLAQSLLLKSICEVGEFKDNVREYVLAAFQQYLRNNNSFTFWNIQADQLEPHYSRNSFHPKSTVIENNVFAPMGRGNWHSCVESLFESAEWARAPWETVSKANVSRLDTSLGASIEGKSDKVWTGDSVNIADIFQKSSTDLDIYESEQFDLVITDPPFGDLVQYSELSDFFYVWLRLALKKNYPEIFSPDYTPKTLEAVANRYREPDDPNGFYERLLTGCWKEAYRILKPGGMLAFTFHHSEDAPWVSVLESLFNAGFYLEATYPIRSDETKGDGQFGSQKVEYDIIHVCRKRTEEPTPVSWGRMRREVMSDVRQLQAMLENHAKEGLPAADIQVIRRGKALEYFSRHYGKVYVDEGRPISVKDALVGINQLIDEDANKTAEPPPVTAEPITRQFLRIFDGTAELARDQMQKLLRGSGIAPDEFTSRGWANEEKKVFHLADPLDFARDWQGKHRRRLTADLDQALVLVGACYDGSGINASDTLKNDNFKPHPALKGLLEWLGKRAPSQPMRNASSRALSIYNAWAASNKDAVVQMSLFLED
jgi:hypothetical protein